MVDTNPLAALITELNIARRNSSAYPSGHPVIASSLAKALQSYGVLLEAQTEIMIGVTSDALMIDGIILDKSNIVYKNFSRVLFERGIGALQLHRGISIEELRNFITILGLKREQINKYGGIEQVWFKAHITAITLLPIRYDLFKSTDEDSVSTDGNADGNEGLWNRFARKLTLGELPHCDDSNFGLDPEVVAEMFNQQFAAGEINGTEFHAAIVSFMTSVEDMNSEDRIQDESYQKLAAFISDLTPELRRQFLDSSFGDEKLSKLTSAERVLSNLTDTAIIETLEDINNNRLKVSTTIFGLLQRLGQNSGDRLSKNEEQLEDDKIADKMKTILREHASEEFVPDDYQNKLNYIIASNQISRLNMEEVSDLFITVENRLIENSINQILMNLIREGVETPEERELLLQNLRDMFGFFLQTGDYGQLLKMIDQLTDGTFPVEVRYRLQDEYGRQEFLEEILDGLSIWGKPRYEDIRSLIHKFGGRFVETILDRLAEEKNMSIRRFYIDCLIDMGPVTRIPITNRLYDNRWYFLRNLLIILTAQNDSAVVPLIQPLLKNEDPRLRHEAVKALVHFRDPQAEKQVLDDLNSSDPELQSAAIQMSERCSSLAIANKLIVMLSQGGYSHAECEKKNNIIHALAEIGRAEVLPELAKILGSRSLLHSRQLTKLKAEIIRSLPKYQSTISRPILEHIANDSGELANLASESLKIISGKNR